MGQKSVNAVKISKNYKSQKNPLPLQKIIEYLPILRVFLIFTNFLPLFTNLIDIYTIFFTKFTAVIQKNHLQFPNSIRSAIKILFFNRFYRFSVKTVKLQKLHYRISFYKHFCLCFTYSSYA